MHDDFGDVLVFLEGSDMPHATTGKLFKIVKDPAKSRKLRIELTMHGAMEPFVKATYVLEGDGTLALVTHEQISMLFSVVSSQHYPNVAAVTKPW